MISEERDQKDLLKRKKIMLYGKEKSTGQRGTGTDPLNLCKQLCGSADVVFRIGDFRHIQCALCL